jgi:Zn finger protein HypA/HybF involved in hydrogenase expression
MKFVGCFILRMELSMKITKVIRKCMDCNKSYGREFEEGKCPFCNSTNNLPLKNKKLKEKD